MDFIHGVVIVWVSIVWVLLMWICVDIVWISRVDIVDMWILCGYLVRVSWGYPSCGYLGTRLSAKLRCFEENLNHFFRQKIQKDYCWFFGTLSMIRISVWILNYLWKNLFASWFCNFQMMMSSIVFEGIGSQDVVTAC